MDVFISFGSRHKPWNLDKSRAAAPSQGIGGGPTSGLESWDPPEALEDIGLQGEPFGRAGQSLLRYHLHGENALTHESRIDRFQLAQTANEESGAGEQDHRQRHLRRYQRPAEPHRNPISGNAS